eukprot:4461826-Pyramimonas_sp.AAC.1
MRAEAEAARADEETAAAEELYPLNRTSRHSGHLEALARRRSSPRESATSLHSDASSAHSAADVRRTGKEAVAEYDALAGVVDTPRADDEGDDESAVYAARGGLEGGGLDGQPAAANPEGVSNSMSPEKSAGGNKGEGADDGGESAAVGAQEAAVGEVDPGALAAGDSSREFGYVSTVSM